MKYSQALLLTHQIFRPEKYVEIGVAEGVSLNVAQCTCIGIDPSPRVSFDNDVNKKIYIETSDDFFSRYDLNELFQSPFDLAFIDGMHLVEYALRDFMNLEKHSHMGSCILIDDILPDKIDWAGRVRKREEWTGDVYRLIYILKKYRPDLDIEIFSLDLKGIAFITNVNKESSNLEENYDNILREINDEKYVVQDRETLIDDFMPRSPNYLQNWLQEKKHELNNRRYLELLKSSLVNEIYADNDLRIIYLKECLGRKRKFIFREFHDIEQELPVEYQHMLETKRIGRLYDRDIKKAGYSHSMIGLKRMSSLISCLDIIRKKKVEGELIECGVWRGGSSIMMAAYNRIYNLDKKILVADSFQGLPKSTYKEDLKLDLSSEKYPELSVSIDSVKQNFKKYNLLSDNIIFINGWFKDTLYELDEDLKISLLRLDGDLYESTMNILDALYDKVSPGGIIVVDDFGLKGCRQAVMDFLNRRNLEIPEFQKIDWTGIFWIKKG